MSYQWANLIPSQDCGLSIMGINSQNYFYKHIWYINFPRKRGCDFQVVLAILLWWWETAQICRKSHAFCTFFFSDSHLLVVLATGDSWPRCHNISHAGVKSIEWPCRLGSSVSDVFCSSRDRLTSSFGSTLSSGVVLTLQLLIPLVMITIELLPQ